MHTALNVSEAPKEWGNVTAALVALAFPPKMDAEVLQSAKAHKYLSALPQTNVQVITSRETANPLSLVSPDITQDTNRTNFALFTNRYVNYAALRWFPQWTSRPDIKGHAVRKCGAIAAALPIRPDIVISRSYPITAALIGRDLADHFNVPWIMQLSDPWVLSPLHPKGYAVDWNANKEAACFERADLITFTSQRTLQRYEDRYPEARARMRYFPNTFDPDDICDNPWSKGDRMRLVYTGTLGDTRTPNDFCDAVERFLAQRPEAAPDIEVILAGHASRSVRTYLASKTAYLNYLGPVSFARSMELLRSADMLVVIDNAFARDRNVPPGSYEFFPSKLLDYMLAQRPILAITEPGSLSQEVIAEQGLGSSFPHGHVSDIASELERRWLMWRRSDRETFEVDARSDVYDAHQNALRLRSEIERLVHGI